MFLHYFHNFSFFFNDTAPTEIYTLSLHDALPISGTTSFESPICQSDSTSKASVANGADRKSTRLNSSHRCISYAVFCLKKKKKKVTLIAIKQKMILYYAQFKHIIAR